MWVEQRWGKFKISCITRRIIHSRPLQHSVHAGTQWSSTSTTFTKMPQTRSAECWLIFCTHSKRHTKLKCINPRIHNEHTINEIRSRYDIRRTSRQTPKPNTTTASKSTQVRWLRTRNTKTKVQKYSGSERETTNQRLLIYTRVVTAVPYVRVQE